MYSAIIAWLNINASLPESDSQTSYASNQERLVNLPHQVCWENDSYLKFRNTVPYIYTEPIQNLIRDYMTQNTEDVNAAVEDVANILTVTSKLCLKIKTKRSRKRIKITSNKKWFDREC